MIVNYYNGFKNSMIMNNANFQFLADEIKVLLITDQYNFDATHFTLGSLVSGDELVGEGYAAGGKSLSNKSRANQSLFADNLSWAQITGDVSGALIYKAAGGALIAHVDFQFTFTPSAEEFQLNWGVSGIFVLSTD